MIQSPLFSASYEAALGFDGAALNQQDLVRPLQECARPSASSGLAQKSFY
jgi:hypothetical protein